MARKLTIVKCGDCPHHKIGPSYSLDGWDRGSDWTCKLTEQVIVKFCERHNDEPTSVPEFCPLPVDK